MPVLLGGKKGTFFVVLTLKFSAKKRQMPENIAFSIDCSYSFSSRELHEIKFKTHIKISVEHFDFYCLVLTVKKKKLFHVKSKCS